MTKTQLLKTRLLEIGASLNNSGHALALLALGSCGKNQELMDEYSDLDFFVIVKPGYKMQYIENLDWLKSIFPAAFYFRNTDDGYKFLYEDGVFCEFAVFEKKELEKLGALDGSIVWKDKDFEGLELQMEPTFQINQILDTEWMLGEILTNLYVGLCRFRRGEKFSAYKFIQNYAVDQLLRLLLTRTPQSAIEADKYDLSRRIEFRNIITADLLSSFIQGYDKTPQSALSILQFLDRNFTINQFIKLKIEELL